jgi:hypothetical protein
VNSHPEEILVKSLLSSSFSSVNFRALLLMFIVSYFVGSICLSAPFLHKPLSLSKLV